MENTSMTSLAPHFESILDTLSDGVFVSDAEGTTLFVNKMYETLTGLRQGEIRGKNIRTLVQQGLSTRSSIRRSSKPGNRPPTSSSSPTGSVWS